MIHIDSDSTISKIARLVHRVEMLRLDDFLNHVYNWKKRLFFDFLSGIARGIGFSIGFSILGALLIYLLRKAVLENMPVIGRFLADIIRIMENNL